MAADFGRRSRLSPPRLSQRAAPPAPPASGADSSAMSAASKAGIGRRLVGYLKGRRDDPGLVRHGRKYVESVPSS
jgi:hypothetical protein